jgi:hypothetical protein
MGKIAVSAAGVAYASDRRENVAGVENHPKKRS